MVDFAKMVQLTLEYDLGPDQLTLRGMNDLANNSPMRRIGMDDPVGRLRSELKTHEAA